jgi:hypothetical protein
MTIYFHIAIQDDHFCSYLWLNQYLDGMASSFIDSNHVQLSINSLKECFAFWYQSVYSQSFHELIQHLEVSFDKSHCFLLIHLAGNCSLGRIITSNKLWFNGNAFYQREAYLVCF